MMKRISLGLALVLVVGALASPAAGRGRKPKPRKLELTYSEPALGTAGFGLCFQGSSCLFFDLLPKERFVSVAIEDDTGMPVYASVIQDTNEDGSYLRHDDLTVDICGKTEKPIEVEPGKPTSVWVWQGPGASPPCPGVASSGTATITLSGASKS
ncbi:MAG: hypothetical protein M3N53_04150 [Actinomycetota bacterium]|nr:hypothetical protein [Actinomycetota bacterium]